MAGRAEQKRRAAAIDREIRTVLARANKQAPTKRQQLESTLATTFIAQQKERVPSERTRLWNECLRLVAELEKLNEPQG